ncbi:MAG: hypothetical protein ACYTHM_09620 [Planctomycetota bacterium]|jgi:hypothetical protein
MNKALKIGGMVTGGIFLAVGLAFLLGFAVQALWNWLLPDLFGLPEITYWQAWGLLILAHLLLGGGPRVSHQKNPRDKGGFHRQVKASFGPHAEPEGSAS